jgi:hypothetical protein
MTTLTSMPTTGVRPVRWRALAWVAWRNHRGALAGILGALGLLAGYLVIHGLATRSAHSAYESCLALAPASCQSEWEAFRDGYGQRGILDTIVMLVPGLVGVFAGAPVFARELESGTFRYTWTQGAGRMRWAVVMLATGAVGAALVAVAFGLLVQWQQQPLVEAELLQRLDATAFPAAGPAAAGWATVGFALGSFGGLLLRRAVPALAAGLAAWFCLAFVTATVLRPRDLTPQADMRYWTLQWIEFGWLMAFALVVIAATLTLLHRRPS